MIDTRTIDYRVNHGKQYNPVSDDMKKQSMINGKNTNFMERKEFEFYLNIQLRNNKNNGGSK